MINPLVQKTIAVFTLCHEHPNRHPFWVLPIEMGDKRGKRQHGKVPKPAKGISFPLCAQERTAGRCVWVRSDSGAYRTPSLSLPSSSSLSLSSDLCLTGRRLCHVDSLWPVGQSMNESHMCAFYLEEMFMKNFLLNLKALINQLKGQCTQK